MAKIMLLKFTSSEISPLSLKGRFSSKYDLIQEIMNDFSEIESMSIHKWQPVG